MWQKVNKSLRTSFQLTCIRLHISSALHTATQYMRKQTANSPTHTIYFAENKNKFISQHLITNVLNFDLKSIFSINLISVRIHGRKQCGNKWPGRNAMEILINISATWTSFMQISSVFHMLFHSFWCKNTSGSPHNSRLSRSSQQPFLSIHQKRQLLSREEYRITEKQQQQRTSSGQNKRKWISCSKWKVQDKEND